MPTRIGGYLRRILRIASVLILAIGTSATCRPNAHFASRSQGIDTSIPDRIGPDVLEKRYQQLWESVGDSTVPRPPDLIVQLGAVAGTQIAAWAKVNVRRSSGVISPRVGPWAIQCHGTNSVDVREELRDSQFGVAMLVITRGDEPGASRPCVLSVDGMSAEIVLPPRAPAAGDGRFSFLAFSCNEPFNTKYGVINARDLSLWLRMGIRTDGENSNQQLPDRPAFVLGLGDQVYVDPDPKTSKPIAFMRGEDSDQFLIHTDTDSLYRSFDVLYRYNLSLPPLAKAFARLPAYLMWDDHEIRDGWGSHRDSGSVADTMANYFRIARHAFIANQLLRSYAPGSIDQARYDSLIAGNSPLHRQFSHGQRTHILMLDGRSTRSPDGSLIDATARDSVQRWLSRGSKQHGDLYVLGVGVPLFPERQLKATPSIFRKVRDFAEIDDDLRDGWDSKENGEAKAALLHMLATHFAADTNDRLLVLSGDVHYSSLYFISLGNRVIGHEVVTSGIAHALPGIARSANWLLDRATTTGSFTVTPAGKINNSAAFAELSVNPRDKIKAPEVDLVFHLNGTLVRRSGITGRLFKQSDALLGNTNLLHPSSAARWYFPYDYDWQNQFAHLAAAAALPDSVVPAGTLLSLTMELPQLRSRWSTNGRVIQSVVQTQSVFCTVPGAIYDSIPARSWQLDGLANRCERLRDD
jgi:hypothetical protein